MLCHVDRVVLAKLPSRRLCKGRLADKVVGDMELACVKTAFLVGLTGVVVDTFFRFRAAALVGELRAESVVVLEMKRRVGKYMVQESERKHPVNEKMCLASLFCFFLYKGIAYAPQ